VHVAGAAEQIKNLGEAIVGLQLPWWLAWGLKGALREALEELREGKPRNACGPMQGFIDAVRFASSQRAPRLSSDQAHSLLDAATRIRAVLDCRRRGGVHFDGDE
jgi:hypothetical protein